MEWNVAQAKQRLSEVLRSAADEPQRIYKRRQLVAAVVSGELFEEFWRWKQQSERQSIGADFAELRAIGREEGGWELPDVSRQDRPNPFAEGLLDATLRHERSK